MFRGVRLEEYREMLLYLFRENKRFLLAFIVFASILLLGLFGPIFYTKDPFAMAYKEQLPPSLEYPLGTDRFGRDILAQLLYGIKTSLYIGFIVAVISITIGTILGAIAGFFGGFVDTIIDNLTNMMLTIPSGLILIIITSYIPNRTVELLAVVMSIFLWPGYARGVRGMVSSIAQSEYVMLARASGQRSISILIRDVLPNMAPFIIVNFASFIGSGIWMETGLSFLGLGALRSISLGSLLYWAGTLDAIRRGLYWMFIPPGVIITATISSIQVIAVSLESVFNPRLREVGVAEV
jgi:peptide/nickel transport system permease protein